MSLLVELKLVGLHKLGPALGTALWEGRGGVLNQMDNLLMLVEVCPSEELLLALATLVIFPCLMQQNVILEVGLLIEGGLALITLELLLPGVLLHVPGHVFGCYGLATDMTIGTLL